LKLPRDISGEELAHRLRHYGYQLERQTGIHLQLASTAKGNEHHITIPAHKPLKVGMLSAILRDVAAYLEIDRTRLAEELFDT